jgi:hypothetical protein
MNLKRILWYAARVLSAVLAGIYLLFILGNLIEGGDIDTGWESIGVSVSSLSGIASIVWEWIDARRGAWAMLVVGAAFSIFALFTAGRLHWFAMLVSGGPYLLIGVLFLVGKRTERD